MVQSAFYRKILSDISTREQELSISAGNAIDHAGVMITFLHDILCALKEHLNEAPFTDSKDEIGFFREVKPQVMGKLIFYNDVYRIETTCPVQGGKMYRKYFSGQLKLLKQNKAGHPDMDFYRYYRSGRRDKDTEFFQRNKLHFINGLDIFYFEMDPHFSTYYDHLVARILAHDLLYAFLLSRVDPDNPNQTGLTDLPEDLCWTGTKNALIELIYALYISGVISHGKIGVRKVGLIFQGLFKTPLGDIHHAFHRMKDRAGRRTLFIDQLKDSLEHYMDKSL